MSAGINIDMSKNKVRVPNIQATIVLRCSNAPDLKVDSESVRIFEISQQMPKIPTFFQNGSQTLPTFCQFTGYFGLESDPISHIMSLNRHFLY